jgi:hypothetical protein
MKVFYKGKEMEEEPGRDVTSVLEYVDKLTTSPFIEINSNSEEEIHNFKSLYGENTFLVVYDSKESDFFKCVENYAENKFKTTFYFGLIPQDKYTQSESNKIDKFPAIIVKIIFYKNIKLF